MADEIWTVSSHGDSKASLAEANSDEFLSWFNHELRSPLTTLLAWSQLLRSGKISPQNQDEALATIEKSGKAIEHLINDVTDFMEIRSGKYVPNAEISEWLPLLQNSLESAVTRSKSKPISIETDFPSANPPLLVAIDKGYFQRALQSFFSDIFKHSKKTSSLQLASGRNGFGAFLRMRCRDFYPLDAARCLGLFNLSSLTTLYGGKLTSLQRDGAVEYEVTLPESSAAR